MKRFLYLLFCVCLLGLGATTLASAAPETAVSAQTTPTATINTGALNVRSGPGVGYSVVVIVYQNNTVTLVGRNSNSSWVNIRTASGQTGWVNASYLTTSTTISSLPLVDTPPLSAAAAVNTGSLNVRTGPGVTYSVITAVGYGQNVSLLGRNGNTSWIKIQLANGQQGWVNGTYLTANVTLSSLPVVDAPAPPEPPVPVAPNALLSLRAGPSFSDAVIGQVFQGQRVRAIGRNAANSWIKVLVLESGLQGWIGAAYLQLDVPIGNLPISDGSTPATPTTPTPTPPTSGVTAVVATGALNVRSGPGAAYSIVTTVNQGATVTLTGRNNLSTWVQVKTASNVTGWVNASLISITGTVSTLPVIDVPTQTATAVVNTGALNVRSGPTIQNSVVAVIQQGTVVGLIGRNSNSSWVQVRLSNGQTGWVNASYVQANTTINSLPISN